MTRERGKDNTFLYIILIEHIPILFLHPLIGRFILRLVDLVVNLAVPALLSLLSQPHLLSSFLLSSLTNNEPSRPPCALHHAAMRMVLTLVLPYFREFYAGQLGLLYSVLISLNQSYFLGFSRESRAGQFGRSVLVPITTKLGVVLPFLTVTVCTTNIPAHAL